MKDLHVRRDWGEAIVSLTLGGLGIALLWFGQDIPRGSPAEPGPGVLPSVLGLLLAVLGVAGSLRALSAGDRRAKVAILGPRPLLCIVCLVGVAMAFEPLGFVSASFLFLAILFYGLGEMRVWRAVALAALVSGAAWLVFAKALSVTLPAGSFFG